MTASEYTDEFAIAICASLADREPLSKIAKCEGMPSLRTIYRWVKDNPAFAELHSHARADMATTPFNQMIAISDEAPLIVEIDGEKRTVRFDAAAVARNRERIHARQWAGARLLPRVYGDTLQFRGAEDLPPMAHDPIDTARRIAFLFAKPGA
jgi:hypothetical protein